MTHFGLLGLRMRIFRSGYSLGFSLLVSPLGGGGGAGVFSSCCISVSGLIQAVVFYLRVVVLCSVVLA